MILYKYLPPDRVDVLKNRQIRFTQPGDFNDPFEFRPQIATLASDGHIRKYVEDNFEQIVDQEFSKIGSMIHRIPQELLKPFLLAQKKRLPEIIKLLQPEAVGLVSPQINGLLNQYVGVLCLSEVRDSLLMWGHYTDNHQGFAVGFDSEHPFFSKRRTAQDDFGFLRQVHYQRLRPSVTLADTSSTVWFQTKSEEWAYEKEWRIARVLSDADNRIEKTPFPVCLFEFPADAVTEIIVGLRAAPALLQLIEALATRFPRSKILRMSESPSEYGLLVEEMSKKKTAAQ